MPDRMSRFYEALRRAWEGYGPQASQASETLQWQVAEVHVRIREQLETQADLQLEEELAKHYPRVRPWITTKDWNPCDEFRISSNAPLPFPRPTNRPGGGGVIDMRAYGRLVKITRAGLDKGTETNDSSRAFIEPYGKEKDDAGHIQANELGGRGGVTDINLFPQDKWTNESPDSWYSAARRTTDQL